MPGALALNAAYPNPLNPATTIGFSLPESAQVQLVVYDMLGRAAAALVNGTLPAGHYDVRFEAGQLPSGTYLYRLTTPQGAFTKTMLLMK